MTTNDQVARAAEPVYSSRDIAELTDLSYRQVDHWCGLGVLIPVDGISRPGSGAWRTFTERELQVAAVCAVLAELGCPLPTVREVAAHLRDKDTVFDRPTLWVAKDGRIQDDPFSDGWSVSLTEFEFLFG